MVKKHWNCLQKTPYNGPQRPTQPGPFISPPRTPPFALLFPLPGSLSPSLSTRFLPHPQFSTQTPPSCGDLVCRPHSARHPAQYALSSVLHRITHDYFSPEQCYTWSFELLCRLALECKLHAGRNNFISLSPLVTSSAPRAILSCDSTAFIDIC